MKVFSRPSSLKSLRTGATRILCHQSPRHYPAPSTFLTGDECIPWTSLSLMPSKPSPGGAQVRRILWWLWRKRTRLRAPGPPSRGTRRPVTRSPLFRLECLNFLRYLITTLVGTWEIWGEEAIFHGPPNPGKWLNGKESFP